MFNEEFHDKNKFSQLRYHKFYTKTNFHGQALATVRRLDDLAFPCPTLQKKKTKTKKSRVALYAIYKIIGKSYRKY